MEPLRWKDPHRKRIVDIRYTDPEYVPGYDIDCSDFSNIVQSIKNKEEITKDQDTRYGHYIMSIIEMVICSPKFKGNDRMTKFNLRDQMYFELCSGILSYNPNKKSNIFSYAYRIAYVAGCHYFTNKNKEVKKEKIILEHCYEELQQYIDSISTHKVNTNNVNN